MPMLQAIQRKNGFVSDLAMQEAADISASTPGSYGVGLVYGSWHRTKGRYVIRKCRPSPAKGRQDAVARQLDNELGTSSANHQGRHIHSGVDKLLGMCDQGPALLVNDKYYTQGDGGSGGRHPG